MKKMKLAITVLSVGLLGLLAYKGQKPAIVPAQNATSTVQITCDQTLWQHIYHPARLKVVNPCMAVSGYIEKARPEDDGDIHIQFKVDPQFSNLLNDKNMSAQNGDLVVEPICTHLVIQPDAVDACRGFSQTFKMPSSTNQHIVVVGAYVLDLQHGGWAEIHPVSKILPIK